MKLFSGFKALLIAIFFETVAIGFSLGLIWLILEGLYSKHNSIKTVTYWATAVPYLIGLILSISIAMKARRSEPGIKQIALILGGLFLLTLCSGMLWLYGSHK
jgi:hypothetical protein